MHRTFLKSTALRTAFAGLALALVLVPAAAHAQDGEGDPAAATTPARTPAAKTSTSTKASFTKLTWIYQAVDQTTPDWRQLDLAADGTASATWNGYGIDGRASAAELAKIEAALTAAKLSEVDGAYLAKAVLPDTPGFELTVELPSHGVGVDKELKVSGRYSTDPTLLARLQPLRDALEAVLLRIVAAPHEFVGSVTVSGENVELHPHPETTFVVHNDAMKALLKPLAGRQVRARVTPVSLDDFSFKGGPVTVAGVYGTNEGAQPVVVRSGATSSSHELAVIPNGMSVFVEGTSGKLVAVDRDGTGAKAYVAQGALDLGLPDATHKVAKAAKTKTTESSESGTDDSIVNALARTLAKTNFREGE